VIAYRTTSGRIIDLWSFTPHHLAVASRLAAVVQQGAEAESRPTEEELRAEVLRSLSFAGIGQDSSLDDALRVFVLDLVPRWLSLTDRSGAKTTRKLSWREYLRSRIVDALGLENRGGKSTAARQLRADPSKGGRLLEALRKPTDPTAQARADLLNQVEHLLDLRLLRLAVEEGLPPRVLSDLGRFSLDRGLKLSYREGRVLLAVSRLVRFSGLNLDEDTYPGWREYPASYGDLAWSLGAGDADEFAVEGFAGYVVRLFRLASSEEDSSVLHIPEPQCSDPDVCTAFHLGLFDAHRFLPVLGGPDALYAPNTLLDALNSTSIVPSDQVEDATGLASEGTPFPAPGQWLGELEVDGALTRRNIESILQEARRIRRRWPLAVCLATAGAAVPVIKAGADLEEIAAAIVEASEAKATALELGDSSQPAELDNRSPPNEGGAQVDYGFTPESEGRSGRRESGKLGGDAFLASFLNRGERQNEPARA
jgi:hypothetical protein